MMIENQLALYLGHCLDTYCFSAYQLYAELDGKGSIHLWGGKDSSWEPCHHVACETRFDLGSLTKVVVTTSVVARLVCRKVLNLDASPGSFLAEQHSQLSSVTLKQLLSHSAGLKSWYPVYLDLKPEEGFDDWFLRKLPELWLDSSLPPKICYSDLGFLLLGSCIEKKEGVSLERLFLREVVEPLGLEGLTYGPVSGSVVATEFCMWRNRLLKGEVFDENAYALGGKTAHAGLFGAAMHLVPWAREWLNAYLGRSKWISQEVALLFCEPSISYQHSYRGLGWDFPKEKGSSAGERISKRSFGHLGYTGTSVWIDPERRGIVIFLTNRVHPSRFDDRIHKIRPLIHDLIVQFWDEQGTSV